MYYSTTHPSPEGTITLACQDNKLVGLWLEGQKYFGDTIPENMREKDDIPVFHDAKKWLDRYFAGEKPEISQLSMAPIGGEFRQMVWDILCAIPYGSIAKEVTAKTGKNMSAQAVGGAVGHNPISIIIPCHRVVGSTGSLTGYAGGVETKIKLLELEGVDTSQFFIPKKGTAL